MKNDAAESFHHESGIFPNCRETVLQEAMRCVAEITKYTWILNGFVYWICADSLVISRCNLCLVEMHEILCLGLLTKCAYVETIFFWSPLNVNICCVMFVSDACLLLVYLNVSTLIFSAYVHDWEELLHTLEQKTNIVQSYCKVYREMCVHIWKRVNWKQLRKMKGLEGWRNVVCALEVRISCVFYHKPPSDALV